MTTDLDPLNDLLDSPAAEEAETERFRWKVSKNLTRRLDQYLVDRVGYLSRAEVQRLIRDGLVKLNGKPTKPSCHPRDGDEVEMFAPPMRITTLVPEPIPINVIYEDDHLLALNKQRDMIVHPARGRWTGTLVNGLVYYGKKWSGVGGDWRPGILHRLDRNTTGVMLVAKSDEAHWRLARQFENRTIRKSYMAIVHGDLPLMGDVIDMPIGKDRYNREKQAVRKIEHGGKPAVTLYETRKKITGTVDGQLQHYTLVHLSPKTGRTHQLRVHMTTIGNPIVGDTVYGGREFQKAGFVFDRQALHAFEITFVHPISLETMTLTAPLPEDFTELLRRIQE